MNLLAPLAEQLHGGDYSADSTQAHNRFFMRPEIRAQP